MSMRSGSRSSPTSLSRWVRRRRVCAPRGRMHPAGIRAFYGAFDMQTCIAELRPAVGETVIGARFTPARPLLVLDTTRFDRRPKEQNMFSKSYLKQLRLWTFMRRFMDEIAQPHLPGSEHLEYVPTQAVAEYLVYRHTFNYKGETDRTIDAIVFRSAQRPNGKNIAMFGDAAVVCREDDSRNTIDEEAEFRTINPGFVRGARQRRGMPHQRRNASHLLDFRPAPTTSTSDGNNRPNSVRFKRATTPPSPIPVVSPHGDDHPVDLCVVGPFAARAYRFSRPSAFVIG